MQIITKYVLFSFTIILSGCTSDFMFQRSSLPAKVIDTPIELKFQPKGLICFTGYQINRNAIDFECTSLFQRFLSVLNDNIKTKLIIHHFSVDEEKEYNSILFYDNSNVRMMPRTIGQLYIADSIPLWGKTDRVMSQKGLAYLNSKVKCEYYLSVSGDVLSGDLLSYYELPKPRLIISLYDNQGGKVFCKTYAKDYEELIKFEKNKWFVRMEYYLDKMLVDCAPEINADLAFIENM
jgi:hypothetical protein